VYKEWLSNVGMWCRVSYGSMRASQGGLPPLQVEVVVDVVASQGGLLPLHVELAAEAAVERSS
jgi:hypothetical protein